MAIYRIQRLFSKKSDNKKVAGHAVGAAVQGAVSGALLHDALKTKSNLAGAGAVLAGTGAALHVASAIKVARKKDKEFSEVTEKTFNSKAQKVLRAKKDLEIGMKAIKNNTNFGFTNDQLRSAGRKLQQGKARHYDPRLDHTWDVGVLKKNQSTKELVNEGINEKARDQIGSASRRSIFGGKRQSYGKNKGPLTKSTLKDYDHRGWGLPNEARLGNANYQKLKKVRDDKFRQKVHELAEKGEILEFGI